MAVVTAQVQVWSLAWELPYATSSLKKKKKRLPLCVAGGGGIVLNMKMREKVINILGGIGKIGQYVKIMAFFAP